MKLQHRLLAVAIAGLALAACSSPPPPPATGNTGNADGPQTALGRTVEKAMDQARKELQTENISLNTGFSIGSQSHKNDTSKLPKAEITPAGDLEIEGKAVAIDPAQRALLLTYRSQIITVAEAGMALGVKGADLGMQAAGAAIAGIFSGNTDQVESKVNAETSEIEAEARKLCAGLAPMLVTQQQLAASLPAFAPYARLTQSDIDDCMSEKDGQHGRAEVRDEIRREIRDGIRNGVRTGVQGAVGERDPATAANAAEEAEAASVQATR